MRSATALLLAGALWAGWVWAQQPPASAPVGGLAPSAFLIEEPPAGHVEVMLSGSRGAVLDSGALPRFLPLLHTPGFLGSSSLSTDDPLAPCALLSAVIASAQLNHVFFGLSNAGIDLRVPRGTNILGRYDDELVRAKGGVPRDDPSKAADMVARLVIWRSWGASTVLNTLVTSLSQRQCLAMLVDPARLKEVLSTTRAPAPVMSHAAPVSAYITSVSRSMGDEWLKALPRTEMLGMSSVPTGNPLMPCDVLSALRLAARLNDAWGNRLLTGKLDTDGRPELTPYAEALKKPLGSASVDETAAELLAAGMAAEIMRSNWLSSQLVGNATQGECVAEFFQPGGLRTKVQRAGTTLPLR